MKRVARFMANEKIDNKKSMFKLQKIIMGDNRELFITIDWTTISNKGYHCLV